MPTALYEYNITLVRSHRPFLYYVFAIFSSRRSSLRFIVSHYSAHADSFAARLNSLYDRIAPKVRNFIFCLPITCKSCRINNEIGQDPVLQFPTRRRMVGLDLTLGGFYGYRKTQPKLNCNFGSD